MYWVQKLKYLGALLIILIFLAVIIMFIFNVDKVSNYFTPILKNITSDPINGKALFEVITFIISIIAFVFSLFNFIGSIKPAKIRMFPAEKAVIYANSQIIGFHVPITFINVNSATGVVSRCKMEVFNESTPEDRFHLSWTSFCKDEGKEWEMESQIYPIAVDGKGSIKKVISFGERVDASNKLKLYEGNYRLVFNIWVAGKRNVYNKVEYCLRVDEHILKMIETRKEQFQTRCKSGHVFINIDEI